MTTAYEFGAGTQVGNDFVLDSDGLARFELRKYTADQTIAIPTGDVTWSHIVGDGIRSSLVVSPALTTLKPPAPGLYLMSVNMELEAALNTTVTTVKIVSSLGRIYRLWKGTLSTTSSIINASAMVPVVVSAGTIETFKIVIDSVSESVVVSFGSATDGNTFWQLLQMPVTIISNLTQAIPT